MKENSYECPMCGGDGKETCNNPDHSFLRVMSFHDVGRIGCPVCGHDEDHKVPDGGECEVCDGTGIVTEKICTEFCEDYDIDFEDLEVLSNKKQ